MAALLVALIVLPSAAATKISGTWQDLDPKFGKGAAVCNSAGSFFSCFALRCHPVVGLEFAFFFNVGKYQHNPLAKVSVDGTKYWSLALETVDDGTELALKYSSNVHAELLQALQTGSEFVFDPGFEHTFRLKGSSAAIASVLEQCPPDRTDLPKQATTNTTLYWDTDIPGQDYELGTTSARLRDVTWQQCNDICIADRQCAAFTHNGAHDMCFLKASGDGLKPAKGATSGIITSRAPDGPGNPLPGAKARIVTGLHWEGASDSRSAYVARIRQAAVEFGGDCAVERSAMSAVAESAEVTLGPLASGTDRRFAVNWTSKPLSQQMPLYLVIATRQPVRFVGDKLIALTPGAIAPFGIDVAGGEYRAVIPLHVPETMAGGTIEVLPLKAGTLTLEATLVGYLRTCQEEAVLRTLPLFKDVTAADPVIALRSTAADADADNLRWEIEMPEVDRLLRFNEQRFVLSDMDRNEIRTGDGADVALSPTGRFIAVRSNEGFDILDPMDGQTLVSMGGGDLAWLNNDSFVVSQTGPWARVWIGEPLSGRLIVDEQATSCASCIASEDSTIDVNLESNFAIAAGGLGYGLVSLTDPAITADESNLIVVDKGLKGSRPTYEKFVADLGALAPFSIDTGFNAPLGLTYSHGTEFIVGKMPETKSRDYVKAVAVVSGPVTPASLRSVTDALDEMGLPLLTPDPVSSTIRPFPLRYGEPEYERQLTEYGVEQARIRDEIAKDVAAAGAHIDWYLPSGDFREDLYCDHFAVDDRRLRLAGDIDDAFRFDLGDRVVWAFRALCEGGPTYGTLTWSSYFAVLDTAAIPATGRELVVDDFHTFGNRGNIQVHERDFEIRLFDGRYVGLLVPHKGKVRLFDSKERRMLLDISRSPRGDLLNDIHLDASKQFLVLENEDGTVAIYRLADGKVALEGKYIDGELLIWTPDYFFDGTSEGTEFVQLRFPGQDGEYSFQQFDAALRVPGLLPKVLQGSFHPPELVIAPPPEVSASIVPAGSKAKIEASVASDVQADTLLVYQDGQLTDQLDLQSGAVNATIDRLPGARWATVVGRGANGLVSAPTSVDLGASDDRRTSVRYLGVGVDYYADTAIEPLNFAKADVVNLQLALAEIDGTSILLESGMDALLTDRAATRDAILAAASRLAADTQLGDTAVFLFSGHGLRGQDGKFYMALSGTDTSNIEATSLAWSDLVDALSVSKGRVLVLLDACHSSAAGSGIFATNDDAADGISGSLPSGLIVLSASKGRETSGESFELGSGVFTHAVAEAIAGQRAAVDLNQNGAIEVSEFYSYVRSDVMIRREGKQSPWLSRSQLIGDFALF